MAQLSEYAKKRNFRKTPEPPGKKRKAKTGALSFVVQEHHASHLHYDFRLELNGVLKSWAVPKGPVMDRSVKRLAIEVEDHPLEYGKFHGTIPEGEYGAGEVYIWDKGLWEPKGDPTAALRKGHLDFTLKGKKLKGEWMLLRTKRPDHGKNQWLLMYRGREKTDATEEEPGVADEVEFIEPQLAQLVSAPPEGDEWLHEVKFDGYRIQAHLARNDVRLLTRSGQDWTTKYPSIARALEKLRHAAVLDGEVVAMDEKGRSDFQRLQNALKSGDTSSLGYFVFDLLFLDGEDLRGLPLIERKRRLKALLKPLRRSQIFFSDHIEGHAAEFLRVSCGHALEGIVSKRAQSPYTSGRGGDWTKAKCQNRQEFVIGGFTEGTGSRVGFGALLLGVYEDGELRYSGRVGTGFDQKDLASLAKKLRSIERGESPFKKNSPRERGLHWVKPVLVAEVSFANWTQDRVLRVPVFHGLREDKPPEEIHMEKPKAKPSAAKEDFVLTHPDKIIYAKERLTKLDVARYYEAFADRILPHMAGRPLTLVRCPEGTSGECFFQKSHPTPLPPGTKTVHMSSSKGDLEMTMVDSREGLLSLVQLGTYEFHVGNCHGPAVDRPDQVVIDFDPDDSVPWATVKKSALALRGILDGLNLRSFVKLTGGKGVHVHVPFEPRYDWDRVKGFAKALAEELASRDPGLYVTTMSKAARRGRIFVDYLRNTAHATAVSPYSLRARPVSAVAMPLSWEEFARARSSNQYSLKSAKARLKKPDPWKDYFKIKQRIPLLENRDEGAPSSRKRQEPARPSSVR